MELVLLYLWLKIDTVFFLAWTLFMALGVSLLLFWSLAEQETYDSAKARKFRTWAFPTFVVSALLAIFMPDKTEVAVLVAGSYAIDAARSPEAAKLTTLLRAKANEILDKQLKELKK